MACSLHSWLQVRGTSQAGRIRSKHSLGRLVLAAPMSQADCHTGVMATQQVQ